MGLQLKYVDRTISDKAFGTKLDRLCKGFETLFR